jgi:hypothetical protein
VKNVSVRPTSTNVKIEQMTRINLVQGLLCHFVPTACPGLKL